MQMTFEKENLRRVLLGVQVVLFFLMAKLLPDSLTYFSAYGAHGTKTAYAIWLIPFVLLIASWMKERFHPVFFYIVSFFLIRDFLVYAAFTLFFFIFYIGIKRNKTSVAITAIWIAILALLTFVSIYYLHSENALSWFWLMLHVSWALKLMAWAVTVRIYNEEYSVKQFISYFFNPVFFFFTNDLNVLTPRKFFGARVSTAHFDKTQFHKVLKQTFLGMALLILYGVFQKYYFLNLNSLGIFGYAFIGSVVSIFTAIVFHGANSCIQVAMLNAFRYELAVDMNSPWKATSPSDYWKRMHFYVRDYIFEIITKPILTNLIRWNIRMAHFRILILGIIYLIFSCTQIGYQPYRQDRSLLIGFLVTGVFVAMMSVPELLLNKRSQEYIEKRPWLGRLMTFMILYIGYYFIFAARKGF